MDGVVVGAATDSVELVVAAFAAGVLVVGASAACWTATVGVGVVAELAEAAFVTFVVAVCAPVDPDPVIGEFVASVVVGRCDVASSDVGVLVFGDFGE